MSKTPSRKARKEIKFWPELYKARGIDAAEKNAAKLEYSDVNWQRSVREKRHQNWRDQALIFWGKESSRKPMEKTPAARQKLEEIRGIQHALEFKRTAKALRKQIPKPLSGKARRIAQEKLKKLRQGKVMQVQRYHLYQKKDPQGRKIVEYKKSVENTATVPRRYENIAKVLSQLGRENMLAGKEAMIEETPFVTREREKAFARRFGLEHIAYKALGKVSYAQGQANWSTGGYTACVFFDWTAFYHQKQWGYEDWGEIRQNIKNAVIGIQVFDPNPKKLLEVARAMAKRRPHDPIPIIDLYGNVFYP